MQLSDLVAKGKALAGRVVAVSLAVKRADAPARDDAGDAELPAVVSGEIRLNLPALRQWPAAARLLKLRTVVEVTGDADE